MLKQHKIPLQRPVPYNSNCPFGKTLQSINISSSISLSIPYKTKCNPSKLSSFLAPSVSAHPSKHYHEHHANSCAFRCGDWTCASRFHHSFERYPDRKFGCKGRIATVWPMRREELEWNYELCGWCNMLCEGGILSSMCAGDFECSSSRTSIRSSSTSVSTSCRRWWECRSLVSLSSDGHIGYLDCRANESRSGQCGAGKGVWTGPTACMEGTCQAIQEYYSQ